MATIAGLGAGIAAGILLSPKNGQDNREDLKRTLTKAGDDINTRVRGWTDAIKSKMENKPNQHEEHLVMHGSWEDVKRQLSANYAELTEEDLSYEHGREHELMERLQTRLKKTKDEVRKLISDLKRS